MYYTIIDTKYIRQNDIVSDYISLYAADSKEAGKFIKGITNVSKVTSETKFNFYDDFTYIDDMEYVVLENSLGCFIVRADNSEFNCEDALELHDIKSIIKNGDKTILIENFGGRKYTTTRSEKDRNDVEKAVMILLLKKEGYSVEDIYEIIASVRNTTKRKSNKTKSTDVKVSKKALKVVEETEIKPETV